MESRQEWDWLMAKKLVGSFWWDAVLHCNQNKISIVTCLTISELQIKGIQNLLSSFLILLIV